MNKEEIIEMLHDIAKTVGGFDGQARGLLKINDYVMKLKENTTTENSDVIKRKIVIENKAEFMNFIKAANEYLSTIQK